MKKSWKSGVFHDISWILSVVISQYKENTQSASHTHLRAAFGRRAASGSLWNITGWWGPQVQRGLLAERQALTAVAWGVLRSPGTAGFCESCSHSSLSRNTLEAGEMNSYWGALRSQTSCSHTCGHRGVTVLPPLALKLLEAGRRVLVTLPPCGA